MCISLCSNYNRLKCAHVDRFLCVILLSEWVRVTVESEATTNSDDFDPLFLDFSPFFFRTSSVVQHLSRIAWNVLECYSELARYYTRNLRFAMCSQIFQVIWRRRRLEGESFFIMILNHLGVRIKRSCLCSYGELDSKEFTFQFSRKSGAPNEKIVQNHLNIAC